MKRMKFYRRPPWVRFLDITLEKKSGIGKKGKPSSNFNHRVLKTFWKKNSVFEVHFNKEGKTVYRNSLILPEDLTQETVSRFLKSVILDIFTSRLKGFSKCRGLLGSNLRPLIKQKYKGPDVTERGRICPFSPSDIKNLFMLDIQDKRGQFRHFEEVRKIKQKFAAIFTIKDILGMVAIRDIEKWERFGEKVLKNEERIKNLSLEKELFDPIHPPPGDANSFQIIRYTMAVSNNGYKSDMYSKSELDNASEDIMKKVPQSSIPRNENGVRTRMFGTYLGYVFFYFVFLLFVIG